MASTTSSAAMPTTSAMCGTVSMYNIPIQDAACAVPNKDKNSELLKKCCNGAPVVAYDNDCAVYCLAYKQSVEAVTNCLFDGKLPYQDAWCNMPKNATATQTSLPSQTSSSSSSSPSSSSSHTESGSPKPSQTTNAAPPTEQKSKFNTAVSIILTVGIIMGAFM